MGGRGGMLYLQAPGGGGHVRVCNGDNRLLMVCVCVGSHGICCDVAVQCFVWAGPHTNPRSPSRPTPPGRGRTSSLSLPPSPPPCSSASFLFCQPAADLSKERTTCHLYLQPQGGGGHMVVWGV